MITEWIEYTGSDEQIAEISNAEHGWVVRWKNGCESNQYYSSDSVEYAKEQCGEFTHYLICNPHPLADMIIRQAQTGQPVWIRVSAYAELLHSHSYQSSWCSSKETIYLTTTPDWNIPNAEYSFTPFEEVEKCK